MKPSRSLRIYKRNVPVRKTDIPIGTIIGAIIIGLVIYLIFRNKKTSSASQYLNKEEWEVSYNSDGLPTKIVIHRNATRNG